MLRLPISAAAGVQPFPAGFRTQEIATNGATIHVRVGGKGPAVVLLHGYAETGDMWAPMAADLARDYTVVVPDLRGLGLSSKPTGGFDKKTQAGDIVGVLDALRLDDLALGLDRRLHERFLDRGVLGRGVEQHAELAVEVGLRR